jgi:spore maturation protein CgeB
MIEKTGDARHASNPRRSRTRRFMKIILAGPWEYGLYHETLASALTKAGATVVPFKTRAYLGNPIGKVESYVCLRGLNHRRCEAAFLKTCALNKPDAILIWGYDMLPPRVLTEARRLTNAVIACYTNDDPFSDLYNRMRSLYTRRRWNLFRKTLPLYDHHFVFREPNVAEFVNAGARSAEVLMMYYDPALHYPREVSPENQSDVIFVGHFENDIRKECLLALKEKGLKVRIHGHYGWDKPEAREIVDAFGRITPIWGDAYAEAISGAKVALCFLSRLNRDEYTTRSFEIPACGSVLLAERTATHQRLFVEGVEAEFFSSSRECVEKTLGLISDPARRAGIASKGYARVVQDGHSVDDCAARILRRLNDLLEHRRG